MPQGKQARETVKKHFESTAANTASQTISKLTGSVKCFYLDRLKQSSGTLLDVGCAQGIWSDYWHGRGFEVTGFDFSSTFIKEAKARFGHKIKFFQADLMEYKTKERFDVVFCCTVLMYIPDYRNAIKKMAARVKPGGALILLEPSASYPIRKLRHLLRGGQPLNVPERAFSKKELEAIFAEEGMKITDYDGFLHFEYLIAKLPFLADLWLWLERMQKPNSLKKYGAKILVKAVKPV
ncbi:class I SAM-dependent methyltransferase [archaeon]